GNVRPAQALTAKIGDFHTQIRSGLSDSEGRDGLAGESQLGEESAESKAVRDLAPGPAKLERVQAHEQLLAKDLLVADPVFEADVGRLAELLPDETGTAALGSVDPHCPQTGVAHRRQALAAGLDDPHARRQLPLADVRPDRLHQLGLRSGRPLLL